ncbi:putative succinoglycan biosynthesis protein ExoA [Candidatus Kuenenia stuttgartiensis]|uniref:Putative succinoglycan biosynthesis protein ExoA n=2 Tax=Kuenenia stuttgartiensis TaxID=174633 RepID=Q1Q1X0_KUEST|nr:MULTISPECIES: glycosyltransferase family 2 protein [Kuenenia]MBE7548661.1 glycosyltransferase family 2 protein [Planctomycetia bacterium]MCZ7621603.1 glycosyltransferase family 2 protein [Candidatus Kuenenia sp.]QII11039.1 putative succinoglycan biosynthesis protein ExoA [Candidatus Kuenenia stuttgartiensis]CAJ74006.1 conserved hypothetical protein [Candidatus Kuenenia stuttgartiensis]
MNTHLSDNTIFDNAFVTIIMPIRNEASFINRSLGSVLAQDYPHNLVEVIIVDGMSDDGTMEIVQSIINNYSQTKDNNVPSPIHSPITLIDNPSRIVPTGLNSAIRHARGDIIIRVDGHAIIDTDYVQQCVKVLKDTGAECVGGPMVTVGETWLACVISLAQSSFFGVGGVAFRTGRRQGCYVDTVAFGAYRRNVFNRIGGFDEELVRNQDDEFNFRLTQSGGKIRMDPSIRSVYYSRSSLRGLWKQYFQYGFYKVRVIQKRGAVPSWRHLIPAVFVLSLFLTIFMALFTFKPLWGIVVIGPYTGANLIACLWVGRRNLRVLTILPVAFLILHLSYGLGFLWGIWYWRRRRVG